MMFVFFLLIDYIHWCKVIHSNFDTTKKSNKAFHKQKMIWVFIRPRKWITWQKEYWSHCHTNAQFRLHSILVWAVPFRHISERNSWRNLADANGKFEISPWPIMAWQLSWPISCQERNQKQDWKETGVSKALYTPLAVQQIMLWKSALYSVVTAPTPLSKTSNADGSIYAC